MEAVVIEQEALQLTPVERALLADHLLQSLECNDDSVMKCCVDEVERRFDLLNKGEVETYDGASVVASLRQQLK